MVNKKVTKTMVISWQEEIYNRTLREERITNIIIDLAERYNLSYGCIYSWVQTEQYREKERSRARDYQKENREKSRIRGRSYARKHRQQQRKYQNARRNNPEFKEHDRLHAKFRRNVRKHIDEFLPQIIPDQVPSASIEEMVDSLYVLTGHSVRPSTLERSIKNYLVHNPAPIIKRVNGQYAKI